MIQTHTKGELSKKQLIKTFHVQYLSYIVRVGSCRGNERFLADVLLGQWDFVLSTRWRLLEGVVEGVRREASVIMVAFPDHWAVVQLR